jgi:L-amino acid N-acyltransferase YncA
MSEFEPSLREARDGDWPFVERLYVEAVIQNYELDAARAAAHVAERRSRWKLEGAYAMVATQAEERLGVVWVLPDAVAANCDYVQLIAVAAPYRRRGVAESLLRAAIERSRSRQRLRLRAGVHRRHAASLKLFARLSFRVEDENAGELLMLSLPLGPA